MTNEEVRSRNAKLVADLKAEVERIQRVRAAAPQMANALIRLVRDLKDYPSFERPVASVDDAVSLLESLGYKL